MIRVLRHGNASGRFEGLGELVLDRPEKRNALTPDMLDQLVAGARDLGEDPGISAVVLRGEGEVFCAGFDLSLCREDSAALAAMLSGLSLSVRALRRLPKPVVIAAQGAAIAGGCALLGGADLVVTHTSAQLGYPVVRLGISPAVSAPSLERQIGGRATRERQLDPALITGQEARRLGLAGLCVDLPEDTVPRAQIEAQKLADKPTAGMRATKAWLNTIDGSMDDADPVRALRASLSLVGGKEERGLLERMWGSPAGPTPRRTP